MKNNTRNPSWPDWYDGKKIDEVQFGRAFLEQRPLKCVNGTLYTLDGPIEDESELKQQILENIEEYVTSGLAKKKSPTFWKLSSCWLSRNRFLLSRTASTSRMVSTTLRTEPFRRPGCSARTVCP